MLMLSGMKTSKLHEQLDVQFAYMPYSKISHPALGASILKSCLKKNRISCNISYLNLNFAELAYILFDVFLILDFTQLLIFSVVCFNKFYICIKRHYAK